METRATIRPATQSLRTSIAAGYSSMALGKKYADLPDLDASQEIYETPALTDDVSTIQTDTVRTDSPTLSDEGGDERLVRARIDQNNARRRFEPTLVTSRGVNFSDTIASGERRSYQTRSRRRRRKVLHEEDGSDSEDETLNEKVARLRRETEEVRLELRRDENASPDIKRPSEQSRSKEMATQNARAVDELHTLLNEMDQSLHGSASVSKEEAFLQTLAADTAPKPDPTPTKITTNTQSPSAAALAPIADRITALETALGLPSVSNSPPSILPTLDHLTSQLDTLTATLIPSTRAASTQPPSTTNPNLDDLQARIRTLTLDADKLTTSRKAAMTSLADLHEARLRYNQARPRDRPHSGTAPTTTATTIDQQEAVIHSDLFLSEQASKITALYQLLPSITELQPLLPVVLDRLRSLSMIHAGAAEARGELDDVMRRQGETRADIERWREAVEETERKMAELKGDMSENVKVVGEMVRGVEGKVKGLGRK